MRRRVFQNKVFDIEAVELLFSLSSERPDLSISMTLDLGRVIQYRYPGIPVNGYTRVPVLSSRLDMWKIKQQSHDEVRGLLVKGSELNFQKFYESTPGLSLILRPDFTIVAVTDEYLQAARSHRDHVIGSGFFDVFLNDPNGAEVNAAKEVKASFEKVLRTRQPDSLAVRKQIIPAQDHGKGPHEVRYWSSINSPLLNENGEVQYIVRRVEDVTRAVHLEEKSETYNRDLFFQYSFDVFAIVGSDGYFKQVNPAFERMLGYSEEELCAKPLVEFMHPEDVEKTRRGIGTLTDGTSTIASNNRYRCRDGSYRWFSWNTMPVGKLFYSVGRDISDQIKAEERIRELNRELTQKNEGLEETIKERLAELQKSEAQVQQLQKMDAIGRLAGGIAHDFNNILGALALYCDILLDQSDDPNAVRESVEEIKNVTDRAAALTRQLLVFSRKQIMQLQTVTLNPLIQQLEKLLRRLIGENIEVVTKYAADLKSVNVDPSQIEQVVLNLVVNARDAMPSGGTITLETSNVYLDESFTSTHLSVSRGHYVLLSVSDTGVGMDSATLNRIFEPFFTTKEVGKGTGLGLTTTYGIIKQCKGTIWVYSEPGRGTVFKIYLPIAEKMVDEPEETPATAQSAVPESRTILLVEDDEKLRAGFAAVLEKKGFKVLVASEPSSALEHCEKHGGDIHLILTDVVMPGISGFELVKKAEILRPNMRALYMSGYTNDALEDSGMSDLGHLHFLQKPFNTGALVAKIQEILFNSPTAQKA